VQRQAPPVVPSAIPVGAIDEPPAGAVDGERPGAADQSQDAIPVVSIGSVPTAPRPRWKSGSDDRPRRAPDPPPAVAESAHGPDQAPGDELVLLEKARRALATDPASALAITDEHVKRFARPSFAQERERLAIDALVRQRRVTEAQQRAARFEATYPGSPHLTRVQALVAPRSAASPVEGGR
jgi:hypothetical protein